MSKGNWSAAGKNHINNDRNKKESTCKSVLAENGTDSGDHHSTAVKQTAVEYSRTGYNYQRNTVHRVQLASLSLNIHTIHIGCHRKHGER